MQGDPRDGAAGPCLEGPATQARRRAAFGHPARARRRDEGGQGRRILGAGEARREVVRDRWRDRIRRRKESQMRRWIGRRVWRLLARAHAYILVRQITRSPKMARWAARS